MARPPYPLKRVPAKSRVARAVERFALRSFGPNGNLTGMRQNKGWQNACPVRVGAYVYDVPLSLYGSIE